MSKKREILIDIGRAFIFICLIGVGLLLTLFDYNKGYISMILYGFGCLVFTIGILFTLIFLVIIIDHIWIYLTSDEDTISNQN